jgi:HlyD family secretion protein
MAKTKNRGKYWLIAVVVLLALSITGGVIYKKRQVPVSVRTDKVERHNLVELVVANGKIQPVVQVKISPEVSGEIIELPVKEGQSVKKGDLLVKIKPDFYIANRNQAEASYKSTQAGTATAEATLQKAAAEYRRSQELLRGRLVSESVFDEAKANYEVAKAQVNSAVHQAEMAKASLDSAEESLSKTAIASPLSGVVTKLNSELGERVLGTIQNVGTEIMTVSDLTEMEARVDIGEVDVVLIKPDQNVRLEVDAYKDRKFKGIVTEIANSSATAGLTTTSSATSQEATKFGVKIRIKEKESFRPGMSCTAEIETRSRTNVLTVPFASVTTRLPKKLDGKGNASTNAAPSLTSTANAATPAPKASDPVDKKNKENSKPIDVVFVMEGDHVKMVPVKTGISDDSYWEIAEGVKEGQEVVSGNYHVISRELEDGKKVKKGLPGKSNVKENEPTTPD